jgi:leucyl aminopeptidase
MTFTVETKKPAECPCEALLVGVYEGEKGLSKEAQTLDKFLGGTLSRALIAEEFKGKPGTATVIHTQGRIPAQAAVVVGLGKKDKLTLPALRMASAAGMAKARALGAKKVAVALMDEAVRGAGGAGAGDKAQVIVEGGLLGTYRFLKYKSEKDKKAIEEVVLLLTKPAGRGKAQAGTVKGEVIGEAVNFARDLVSEPAASLTPTLLAEEARKVAREAGLKIKVMEKAEVEKLGMGAFLGVSLGSDQPPKFIVLSYEPERGGARRKIALVGKGLTFDSGGISLKPAGGMETMKCDMAGSAAVLATMRALGKLKPRVSVLGLVAATENMPSGRATKPGDVVRAMNGKTIEVVNTDAEGRLTLADALCYAVKEKVDEAIDIATLTGACVVALGKVQMGVFANDEGLRRRVMDAAKRAGEGAWHLPLNEDLKEAMKSDIADMKNTGKAGEAGATMGGLFLQEFVGSTPWVHLDIAGPAFIDRETPLSPKGATGVGVRTFLYYLMGI